MFLDDRGQALRVTWHSEAEVVVLSIWRADQCVGTVRLDFAEARRLGAFLDGLVSAAEASPAVSGRAGNP